MSMKLYILDCGQMWTEHGFLWHFGTCDVTGEEYKEGPFGIRNIQFFIDHPQGQESSSTWASPGNGSTSWSGSRTARARRASTEAGARSEPHRPAGQDRGQARGHRLRGHLSSHERARRLPAPFRRHQGQDRGARGRAGIRQPHRHAAAARRRTGCGAVPHLDVRARVLRGPGAGLHVHQRGLRARSARTWRSCRCPGTRPGSRT